MIALPTRHSITNNPLPNHNFGRGPRINCLMIEEESKEDPSKLIYDLPECFMMTWEELMGMTSTAGYDIWSEDILETKNYPISINGERPFKPQSSNPTSINRGDTSNPKILILVTQQKLPTLERGKTLQSPTPGDRQPNRSPE